MIDIRARIHDKFSIEFKVGFGVRRKLKENNFAINTWLFIPNSLDVNSSTYNKSQFYTDVKSNIRLITPVFLLRDICGGHAIPYKNLEKAFVNMASVTTRTNIRDYEYQIKMFTAIFKSALRNETMHIIEHNQEKDTQYVCEAYIENLRNIIHFYRNLRHIINVPTVTQEVLNYYLFGDEFISNIIKQHIYRLIYRLKKETVIDYRIFIENLVTLAVTETAYQREKGYLVVEKENVVNNREFIFRQGILKKYIESDLFLKANKKRDGVLVEQIYFSLAAGLSMIFATGIAFAFQQAYGNFTMPLFAALVVSYMLKDRIKELMRYYFAHKLSDKYYDNKTTILMKEIPIGWSKEGVDFITEKKVPLDVMTIRSRSALLTAENRTKDEKILLYRKSVRLDSDEIKKNSQYTIVGINDIMRLYVTHFTQKMDNPEVPLYFLDDDHQLASVNSEKIYYLNIIMQLQFEEQIEYKRFRIAFSRSGISQIEEFKP